MILRLLCRHTCCALFLMCAALIVGSVPSGFAMMKGGDAESIDMPMTPAASDMMEGSDAESMDDVPMTPAPSQPPPATEGTNAQGTGIVAGTFVPGGVTEVDQRASQPLIAPGEPGFVHREGCAGKDLVKASGFHGIESWDPETGTLTSSKTGIRFSRNPFKLVFENDDPIAGEKWPCCVQEIVFKRIPGVYTNATTRILSEFPHLRIVHVQCSLIIANTLEGEERMHLPVSLLRDIAQSTADTVHITFPNLPLPGDLFKHVGVPFSNVHFLRFSYCDGGDFDCSGFPALRKFFYRSSFQDATPLNVSRLPDTLEELFLDGPTTGIAYAFPNLQKLSVEECQLSVSFAPRLRTVNMLAVPCTSQGLPDDFCLRLGETGCLEKVTVSQHTLSGWSTQDVLPNITWKQHGIECVWKAIQVYGESAPRFTYYLQIADTHRYLLEAGRSPLSHVVITPTGATPFLLPSLAALASIQVLGQKYMDVSLRSGERVTIPNPVTEDHFRWVWKKDEQGQGDAFFSVDPNISEIRHAISKAVQEAKKPEDV